MEGRRGERGCGGQPGKACGVRVVGLGLCWAVPVGGDGLRSGWVRSWGNWSLAAPPGPWVGGSHHCLHYRGARGGGPYSPYPWLSHAMPLDDPLGSDYPMTWLGLAWS